MFAIIESGGKQYRVERGDVIDIEVQPVSGKKVEKVTFDRVLMVHGEGGVRLGGPTIDGAAVSGVVVEKVRGPKLVVFKKKRRKGFRKTRGHRSVFTRVRITDIQV